MCLIRATAGKPCQMSLKKEEYQGQIGSRKTSSTSNSYQLKVRMFIMTKVNQYSRAKPAS